MHPFKSKNHLWLRATALPSSPSLKLYPPSHTLYKADSGFAYPGMSPELCPPLHTEGPESFLFHPYFHPAPNLLWITFFNCICLKDLHTIEAQQTFIKWLKALDKNSLPRIPPSRKASFKHALCRLPYQSHKRTACCLVSCNRNLIFHLKPWFMCNHSTPY